MKQIQCRAARVKRSGELDEGVGEIDANWWTLVKRVRQTGGSEVRQGLAGEVRRGRSGG